MIRFCDSFRHYAPRLAKWDTAPSGGVNPTGGRFSSGGYAVGEMAKVLPLVTSQTKCITGFAHVGNEAGLLNLSGVMDHGNPNDSGSAPGGTGSFFQLNYVGDGTFYCWAGGWTGTVGAYSRGGGVNSTLIYGPGGVPISETSWYYFEVKLDFTSMQVDVHINEESVYSHNFGMSIPGLQVWATTIVQPAVDKYGHYADLVILDDISTGDISCPNNDFLGDVKVQALYTRADGTHTDWSTSAGTDHFSLVNEAIEDEDTTYVSSNTPGDQDSYWFEPCYGIGEVFGVQVNNWSRKQDAGSHNVSAICRTGAADYVHPTPNSLVLNYHDNRNIFDLNPATSAQWTTADIDASEFGIKLS